MSINLEERRVESSHRNLGGACEPFHSTLINLGNAGTLKENKKKGKAVVQTAPPSFCAFA